MGEVTALDLSDSLVEEDVEGGHVHVFDLPSGACHEIISIRDTVSLVEARSCIILRMQHLSNHYFGERVFVHAAGPFMDEHIIVDLRET